MTTRRALMAGTLSGTVAGCLGARGPTEGPTAVTPTEPPEAIGEVQLEAAFADDPTNDWSGDGWRWQPEGGASGDGSVVISNGELKSPSVTVVPQAYYEVEFDAATDTDGLVSMYHPLPFDETNDKVGSDAYTSLLSDRPLGTTQSYMVRGRVDHDETVLQFRTRGTPIELDTVSVTRVSGESVAAWSDAVIERAAPITYEPPDGRFDPLPATRSTLADGASLTVVIVGDSIMNDLANGHPDVLLERTASGLDVELATAVRGSTGVGWFASSTKVQEHIRPHDPDLVVAGGISTKTPGQYRDLIDVLAAESSGEVLALTGGVAPPSSRHSHDGPSFRQQVASIAEDTGVGFFDSRAAFEAYLDRTGLQRPDLQRDSLHANSRGKAVMARLLTRFLTPDD